MFVILQGWTLDFIAKHVVFAVSLYFMYTTVTDIMNTNTWSCNIAYLYPLYQCYHIWSGHTAIQPWERKPANNKETNQLPTSLKQVCLATVTSHACCVLSNMIISHSSHSQVSMVVTDGLVAIWHQGITSHHDFISDTTKKFLAFNGPRMDLSLICWY